MAGIRDKGKNKEMVKKETAVKHKKPQRRAEIMHWEPIVRH